MKKLSIFGMLLLLALCSPMAHAALDISFRVGGVGAITLCATGADTGPVNCAAGGGALDLTATSTSPGSLVFPFTRLFESTTSIDTAAGGILEIWIGAQNFSVPTTPPDLNFRSNLAVTVTAGGGTADLTSCVDITEDRVPPTGLFCSAGVAGTTMATNPSLALAPGTNSSTVVTTIPTLAAEYSIQQYIKLVLDPNSSVNLVTSAVLTQVPEPASMMLLGSALLGLTVAFRKKLAKRS